MMLHLSDLTDWSSGRTWYVRTRRCLLQITQLQWPLGKCPANDRRDPDAYRKSPGGVENARRKIVSISCFQDICSRNSSDARTVGDPATQACFVPSNAGERPPTLPNAGSIAKRPE